MLIHMTMVFASDRVELKVARPYMHRVEANLVAIERAASSEKRGPMILAFGECARSLSGEPQALVKPAYDPDSFEPELTGAFVDYHRTILFQEVRSSFWTMFALGSLDRFRIDLLLPRFEQLPPVATERLALAIRMSWRRAEIFVNHRRLPKPNGA